MQSDTVNIFVSSTCLDLGPERRAVEAALQRMREAKFVGMEYFGSREDTTLEVSLAEVDRCRLYVGIIGGRYGSGITEAEYRRARDKNLPCFVYLKSNATVEERYREADADKGARLGTFVEDLRRSQTVMEFTNPDQLAAMVVADLHRWLADNIYLPAARQAAGNDFSFARLGELISDERNFAELQEELRRLTPSGGVMAQGARSVALGGGNTGTIHTGDVIFQIFTNAPSTLAQYFRVEQFCSLINDRTRGFVGRDFIFKAVDGYISGKSDEDFHSGYIIILGEPGIGKTAISGQLVKLRGYVHHFNIATQNIRSARDFLGNVCAQLIVRYKLAHQTLPPAATQDSGFLSQLLGEAAAKAGGQPVVIVVDALDEAEDAGLPAGANRLLLPPSLPEGVFLIVTSREKRDYKLNVDHSREIYINDASKQNRDDVRQYVRNFIDQDRDRMAARIVAWNVGEEEFVEAITEMSQGNFMYLVHVLRDIREGKLTTENVDNIYDLPAGLKKYYQRHWHLMHEQNPARFEEYYEPIICILASASEPVPLAQLVTWTKTKWPHLNASTIRDVLQVWREFLNEERAEQGPPRYRIYHTSFQDFLREEVGLAGYHAVIGLNALEKIPGFTIPSHQQ
jgi:hypothetical protein